MICKIYFRNQRVHCGGRMPERTAPQALALARSARVRAMDGPNNSRRTRQQSEPPSRWPFLWMVEAAGCEAQRARSAPGSLRRQDAGADSASGAGPRAQREGEGHGWPEPFPPPATTWPPLRWPFLWVGGGGWVAKPSARAARRVHCGDRMPERTAPRALALARSARVRAMDGPNQFRRKQLRAAKHSSGLTVALWSFPQAMQ